MNKSKLNLINILKVFLVLFAITIIAKGETVHAESYTYSFDVYKINDVATCFGGMDEDDIGQAERCMDAAMSGTINNKKITDGYVEAGDKLFVVLKLQTSADATGYTYIIDFQVDNTKLIKKVGSDYFFINDLPSNCANTYSWGIAPVDTCTKKKQTSTYSGTFNVNSGTLAGTGVYSFMYECDSTNTPLAGVNGGLLGFYVDVSDSFTSGESKIEFLPNNTGVSIAGDGPDLDFDVVDTTLRIYQAPVVKSDDTTLSALVGKGTINSTNYTYTIPSFVPSSTTNRSYTIYVPYALSSITFEATATDDGLATFDVGDVNVARSLSVGENNLTIGVTAEDGQTHDVYNIKVVRLSNDTSLKTFTTTNSVNYGTLANINANHGGSVTVPYKTATTTVTATGATGATVTGTGAWNFTTDDLANQNTTKKITVNAQDCSYTSEQVPGNTCTSQEYEFITTRTAPTKGVGLATLTVDGNPVTIPAAGGTTTLTAVGSSKGSIVINATPSDSNSTVVASSIGQKTVNTGDNTYEIVVNAEDCESGPSDVCTTAIYKLALYKKSDNNLLQTLTISTDKTGGYLSSTFASGTKNYTYYYVEGSSTLTVAATVADTDKASVNILDMSSSEEPDNTSKTLNSASATFNTLPTKVGVVVTSEEGNIEVYKITLERKKSDNVTINDLALSNATITPVSGVDYTYEATVGPTVESSEVTYTLDDTRGTSTVTGGSNYQFGVNHIYIDVTAEDTHTTRRYTINVTRQKYDISTLSDLRVGIGSATPTTVEGFPSATNIYEIAPESNPVPFGTTQIIIEADKGNSYEVVTGDGQQTLQTGKNEFTVTVTSHDQNHNTVYKIIVYREKNSDCETKSVSVKGYRATVNASDDSIYELTVGNNIASITGADVVVNVSPDATVEKLTTGTLNLSTETVNEFQYKVIAEDLTEKTYTIKITRALSTNANLASLTDNLGKIAYSNGIKDYPITVQNSVESITIDVETVDSDTTIAVDSEHTGTGTLQYTKPLDEGLNTIQITTTAPGGNIEIYRVLVTRLSASGEDPTEQITSNTFGHTIDTAYVRTVADKTKPDDLKAQFDNDASKLEVWKADDSGLADSTKPVGTGMILKLKVGGTVVDSKVIVVLGDTSGDGTINASDISLIIAHFLRTNLLTGPNLLAGNANKDAAGTVNASDISVIIGHFLRTAPIVFK